MTPQAKLVFERALRLARKVDNTFIELGQCLMLLHEMTGQPGLLEFSKTSSMGRRKLYYLIQIARLTSGRRDITYQQLRRVGWSKLTILLKYLDHPDIQHIMEQAEELPKKTLERWLVDRKTVQMHQMLLVFTPAQYRFVVKVLKDYGGRGRGRSRDRLANKEEALIRIFQEKVG